MSYPYYNNKPQYYDGSANESRVVVQTEPEEPKKWNWCSHGWSMFALFCCPWCVFSWMFAFCGVVCAMGSYSDHKAGDYERSAYKKSCAIGLTVTAIVLGLAVIAVIVYFTVSGAALYQYIINYINDLLNQQQQNLG